MIELANLYQELIIDHSKTPRNFMVMPQASCQEIGHNPLCGDQVTVYVDLEQDTLKSLSFQGSGCAISIASASLMTEFMRGKTLDSVAEIFTDFQELVTSCQHQQDLISRMGKLVVFANVATFPVRVKCATLAWHTLRAALAKKCYNVAK